MFFLFLACSCDPMGICFFLFSACSCDPMGTLEADGCDMETGSCTCKRYVTGQNCDRCYVSTICLYRPVHEN